MKLALSNLLALVAAKKLAFLEEQAEVVQDCDAWMESNEVGCDDPWVPKMHLTAANGGPRPGKSKEECCVKTCQHYACGEGYTDNEAYWNNTMDEGLDPNSICCDKQCGHDFVCNEGYVLGDPSGPGTSSEECCKPTCMHYDCTGPWILDEKKKTVVGASHKECCFPTCKQFAACEKTTGWATWKDKEESAGATQEECCLATCSNTQKITCSTGWFVPQDRDDWVNGTFHNDTTESACCKPTCQVHNCGFGWSANASLANEFGETDEACCVPTCGQHECDWTKGWAKDDSKSAVELHTVEGEENEKCCQPTCKQWQCPNNGTWLTPTGNYKDNLTKQSNEECCAKACNEYTCQGANLVLIPGKKITIGDDDAVCCEPAACPDFRIPSIKTKLEPNSFCNSVKAQADCDKTFEVMTADVSVTLANGTISTRKEPTIVSCYYDSQYQLCRSKVDSPLRGCKSLEDIQAPAAAE